MKTEIHNAPDYASLHVWLDEGEKIVTEPGAMMGMDPALKMETNMKGGLFGAMKRMVGGETVFLNTYTSTGEAQRIDIAPSAPGDMKEVQVGGDKGEVLVQSGGYCACTENVELSASWQGARGFFSGEGLVMLKATGEGTMWITSYGAIDCVEVNGSYIVDTTHIVAFEDSLTYNIRKIGGFKGFFLSAEGRVCEFHGTGKLWIQTRSAPVLASFLHPFRRVNAN